jgi:hypothetical protein
MLVTGKLKFVSLTKNRDKYTLTGEWDDAENPEKQWVTLEEAKILSDEGIVTRDGTWDDGNPKYKVVKRVTLSLEKDWKKENGRNVCHTTIHIGSPSSDDAAKNTPTSVDGWVELEARARECVKIAVAALTAEKVALECHGVARLTNCLMMLATGLPVEMGNDKPEDFKDKPDELKDEEDDDLPF